MINHLDFIASVFPVILLVWLMTKRKNVPSSRALPLVAGILYVLELVYFKTDANITHAAVIDGLLTALTPISIIFGAILLFKTMENSGGLPILREWLNQITPNKVAQLMIVGWSFSFLIEGISGFGTPAALAAPLLVGLGFSAVPVAIFCLMMNSVPVSFGAVGMPTWFGFSQLSLTGAELSVIGFKTALLHTGASLFIPLLGLRMIVTWSEIRKNIVFVYSSILGSVLPYLIFSRFSIEFPTIIGGFIGLGVSILLAKRCIGLRQDEPATSDIKYIPKMDLIKAFFPIIGTIIILLISRMPFLGIKQWLNKTSPFGSYDLGSLGELQISLPLVVQLKNILGTSISWKHPLLYVPSLIPFVLISVICFILFRMSKNMVSKTFRDSWVQLQNPVLALLGALVFVKLFMVGGEGSSAEIVGRTLADMSGSTWQFVAVYLGALGSFFSGSCTVSNLTFASIQDSIAKTLDLDRTTILSLQSVGGAMGNMVCIHNIVAVCAILGLQNQEGFILKKTFWPMLIYGAIAGVVSLVL